MNEKQTARLSPREQKREIERLLETPGWGIIVGVLQAQTDRLQNEILFGPVESEGDVYRLERKKGQLEGRLAVTAMVEALLADLEMDIQRAEAQGADDVEA